MSRDRQRVRPMNRCSKAANPSIVSPEPIPTTPSSVSTRTIVTGTPCAEPGPTRGKGGSSGTLETSSRMAVIRTAAVSPERRRAVPSAQPPGLPAARRETPPSPMAVQSTHRAATVEFEHVIEAVRRRRKLKPRAGARAPSTTCRSRSPRARSSRPRRSVGLRQDHQPEDGQPAHRADVRADPHRRRGHRDARRDRAAAGHRLRHPADRPVPAPDDRGERRARSRGCSAGRKSRAAGARRSCWPHRPRAREVRPALPQPAVRRRAPARRAWPGRSRRTRRSCSWTSRSARSTRSSASGSRTSSSASRRTSPRRSCS